MKFWQVSTFFVCIYAFMFCQQSMTLDLSQEIEAVWCNQVAHRFIKNIDHAVRQYADVYENDSALEINIILVGTYEKIIKATGIYLVTMYNPLVQNNLQDEVIKIIIEDMMKIVTILARELIDFMKNEKIGMQEKILRCGLLVAVIICIKLGLDQIPNVMNDAKENNTNLEEKSSYITGKFGSYR